MPARRVDRDLTLEQLNLTMEAGPFEALAVSGGHRMGDTYEFSPLPSPGPVTLSFLVHGVRYLESREQKGIDQLSEGVELLIEPEPTSRFNPAALLVTHDGARPGWVPDPLLHLARASTSVPHRLTVERVNPPGAGFHTRLLVVLEGNLGVRPD